jgi:hypothetical protein
MTNSDNLLEQLVKHVNDTGKLLDVTLTVAGSTITGRLAPRGKWLETLAGALEETEVSEFARYISAEAGAMDTEEYLHLSSAKTVFGEGQLVPQTGGLLRLRVSAVDGWMIGRFDTTRK